MQRRSLPRGIRRGSQVAAVSLSPPTRRRLEALTLWQRPGQWGLAAEIFGVSRATLYRWRQRYDPYSLRSLEARSRRPRRVRASPLPAAVVQRIQALREQYPRWGREKLRVLLAREGIQVAAETIDRALARLRARGVLREPPWRPVSARKRPRARPYAMRKPKEYVATTPGDLVELDTLDIRPLPGVVHKHLTGRDVISRWDVLEIYGRATATTATRFLDALEALAENGLTLLGIGAKKRRRHNGYVT